MYVKIYATIYNRICVCLNSRILHINMNFFYDGSIIIILKTKNSVFYFDQKN